MANPLDARDVSGDGQVTPIDVLLPINYLNTDLPELLPSRTDPTARFYDVNGDGYVAPGDVLQVINWIRSETGNTDSGPLLLRRCRFQYSISANQFILNPISDQRPGFDFCRIKAVA